MEEPLPQPRGGRSLWRRVDDVWSRNARPGGQFWTHNVEERIGALLCVWLAPTGVAPNMLTLIGVGIHVLVAIYVVTLTVPVAPMSIVIVLVGWQLAFSLDCADGQLARETGTASAFGAWLDQLADFVAHVAVYLALGIFAVRALRMAPVSSAVLVTLVCSASVFYLFASAERNALMGSGGGIQAERVKWLRLVALVHNIPDYGAILFASALLLAFPRVLVPFLIVMASVAFAAVCGQMAYNWMREERDPRDGCTRLPRQPPPEVRGG